MIRPRTAQLIASLREDKHQPAPFHANRVIVEAVGALEVIAERPDSESSADAQRALDRVERILRWR